MRGLTLGTGLRPSGVVFANEPGGWSPGFGRASSISRWLFKGSAPRLTVRHSRSVKMLSNSRPTGDRLNRAFPPSMAGRGRGTDLVAEFLVLGGPFPYYVGNRALQRYVVQWHHICGGSTE